MTYVLAAIVLEVAYQTTRTVHNWDRELREIFRHICGRIGANITEGRCFDSNGNNVGLWSISK